MSEKFIANKNLGQHFLADKNVINTICENQTDKKLAILEIGPGPGVLTKTLVLKNQNFKVIEKDKRFIPSLKELIGEPNVFLGDALKINYTEFLKEEFGDTDVWVVSNLPYNISAPLTIKLMAVEQIKYMTLMYQKEVGDKFVYSPKNKKISTLSALSGVYFKSNTLIKVKPGAFNPPPKVDSVVISFERLSDPSLPLPEFTKIESLLRSLFRFKRKQLKANLKGVISIDSFRELGIDEKIRAEDLSLDQVLEIYKKGL